MKKIIIAFIVIAVILSAVFSARVYRLGLGLIYGIQGIDSSEESVKRAEGLYRAGSMEKLAPYIEDMLVLYPSEPEILRIAGLVFIEQGRTEKGIEKIILSLSMKAPVDARILEDAIGSLFEREYYGDINHILKDRYYIINPSIQYFYAVSLYKTGRHSEALEELSVCADACRENVNAHYISGLAYEKNGNPGKALEHLAKAYKFNERDFESAGYNNFRRDIASAILRVSKNSGEINKTLEIMNIIKNARP